MSRPKMSAGEALVAFFDAPADARMAVIWRAIHGHAHGDKGASALLTMIGRTMTFVPAKRRGAKGGKRAPRSEGEGR